MPSLYAHQKIANDVFNKMDKPNYIKSNYNEFLLGSLGLEIFNYHKLLKMLQNSRLEQLGSTLKFADHRNFLLTLVEYSKGDPRHMVYVIGLITNYAADRTVRPYIHSKTEKAEGGGDVVGQIEFEQALDAYLYREKEMKNTVVQAEFLGKVKRSNLRHVSGLLSSVCRYISSDKRIWRKDIVGAFEDTKTFMKKVKEDKDEAMKKMCLYEAMIGKTGRLTTYVPPNVIQGNDVFNLAHRTWRAPFEMHIARNESVNDLIKSSVDLSIVIINQLNEYYIGECGIDRIEELVGNINFNGRAME